MSFPLNNRKILEETLAFRGGATLGAPLAPRFSPKKLKIKNLPQILLFFQILAPQNFFFQFDPPNLGELAPPLALLF